MLQPATRAEADAVLDRVREAVGPGIQYIIILPSPDPTTQLPAVGSEVCCVAHLLQTLADAASLVINENADMLDPITIPEGATLQ